MIPFLKISPVINIGENFQIRFYALCILTGAIVCFLFCRKFWKAAGFNTDTIDNTFIVALPAGIIGARLWWCACDPGSPWRHGDFWGFITKFTDGGLAIQGGVIFGALAGILFVYFTDKKVKILKGLDCVIPNILLAQAIGRWGNFFNQEVYGACVPSEDLNILPGFIHNQMMGDKDLITGGYSNAEFYKYSAYIKCNTNEAAIPLYLIEGLLNVLGWVLITFVVKKFWKKGRKDGDLAGLYLIWYGVVRAVLEPLRNPEFIMDSWSIGSLTASVVTSIAFIIIGVLFMLALRIIPKIKSKKKHV